MMTWAILGGIVLLLLAAAMTTVKATRGEAGPVASLAMIVMVGGWLLDGRMAERAARAEGWQGVEDRAAAQAAGVTDPAAWAAQRAAAEAVRAAEFRRTGRHCLAGLRQANPLVEAEIRARLRDPGSYRHVETRVAAVGPDGQHAFEVTFRAANGFGGLTVETWTGAWDSDSCAPTALRQG